MGIEGPKRIIHFKLTHNSIVLMLPEIHILRYWCSGVIRHDGRGVLHVEEEAKYSLHLVFTWTSVSCGVMQCVVTMLYCYPEFKKLVS